MKPTRFSPTACKLLQQYVYVYFDPTNGRPFYVGRGVRNRCFSHLRRSTPGTPKAEAIGKLRKLGLEPEIQVLKYGLTDEQAALVETTAIELLKLETLTNRVRGAGIRLGRGGPVAEIALQLNAKPIELRVPCVLINISQEYRPGMDLFSLYDATRSAWKMGNRRLKAKYAMAVYRGVIREVFTIEEWLRGGTTMRLSDSHNGGRHRPRRDRWEFVGHVAEDKIRRRYKGRSVTGYLKPGAQNPVMYVNC